MDITEGNKLISDFMGFDRVIRPSSLKGVNSLELYIRGTENYMEGEIRFHSSWDWLMPVVEKIEAMNIRVEIKKNHTEICSENINSFIRGDNKIDSTWKSVVAFIGWYNSVTPQVSKEGGEILTANPE